MSGIIEGSSTKGKDIFFGMEKNLSWCCVRRSCPGATWM